MMILNDKKYNLAFKIVIQIVLNYTCDVMQMVNVTSENVRFLQSSKF